MEWPQNRRGKRQRCKSRSGSSSKSCQVLFPKFSCYFLLRRFQYTQNKWRFKVTNGRSVSLLSHLFLSLTFILSLEMLYPPCTPKDLSLFENVFPYLLFLLHAVEMLPPFIIFCNSRQELICLLEPSFWFVHVPIVELVSCTRFFHFGPQTRLSLLCLFVFIFLAFVV